MLPWEQLRWFKKLFLTVAEYLKVIKRSPSLKVCRLDNVYFKFPEIFQHSTDSTRSWNTLRLYPSGAAVSPFDSITLPSLSQLRIHYSGAVGLNLSAIRSLVLRSSRNLQRLCIEKRHIYDEDLIPCLESVPIYAWWLSANRRDCRKISSWWCIPLVTLGPFYFPNSLVPECDSHSLVDMLSELARGYRPWY